MRFPRKLGFKAVPWLVVLEVLRTGKEHWDELDPRDRTRLVTLLRKSKGRASLLSTAERAELREIARRLELLRFGRTAAQAAVMGHRRSQGRRR